MKLPRVRFTMWRMMVAVAILALLVSYAERWRRYNRLAAYHLGKSNWKRPVVGPDGRPFFVGAPTKEKLRHREKADEYARAASRPWIWISPEPLSGDPE
jgi:hypothetical protein